MHVDACHAIDQCPSIVYELLEEARLAHNTGQYDVLSSSFGHSLLLLTLVSLNVVLI
jgi:hypothetical protein